MKSVCLSALLYTLKDREVEDNEYIEVFTAWLTKVIENAGLTSQDAIHLFIDTRTMEYISRAPTILPVLFTRVRCPYYICKFDPPATALEGMMHRYDLTNYTQDVYMYTDIDILVMSPLRRLVEMTEENRIYVATEGSLEDANYGAAMRQPIPVCTPPMPGYSSGKFIITSKDLHTKFSSDVKAVCDGTNYYTLDQPYFNKVIHSYHVNNKDGELLTKYTSLNGHGYSKDIILLDGMGEVGNGRVHLRKMMDFLCLTAVGMF